MDRRHRLTSSRDFARVMRTGRRGASGPVAVSIVASERPGAVRIGVSVGRACGGAVKRNRAKRLLREVARANMGAIPKGSDVVLSARGDIAGKKFQEVERAVLRAIEKVTL